MSASRYTLKGHTLYEAGVAIAQVLDSAGTDAAGRLLSQLRAAERYDQLLAQIEQQAHDRNEGA